MKNNYKKQVELLLNALSIVSQSKLFALKGGTAINFFLREVPRLSVDIDLTYLPIEPREQSLQKIREELIVIGNNIKMYYPTLSVKNSFTHHSKQMDTFYVSNGEVQIKVEVNTIVRGTVLPHEVQSLCQTAKNTYSTFVETKLLSNPEIYGGKICAALARQHPRDLFDIKLLMENEGINTNTRQAFVVYLAGDKRPINELLNPNLQKTEDFNRIFSQQFQGMTNSNITVDELLQTRKHLISLIKNELTENERKFLYSLKQAEPDWQLMPFKNLAEFPAIQWKLLNITRMPSSKHKESLEKLRKVLEL
jgi:predicted nucleotidyltransferase component of viral defense system